MIFLPFVYFSLSNDNTTLAFCAKNYTGIAVHLTILYYKQAKWRPELYIAQPPFNSRHTGVGICNFAAASTAADTMKQKWGLHMSGFPHSFPDLVLQQQLYPPPSSH